MSTNELIKKSKELEARCREFAAMYTKLIARFKVYAKAPEIETLETYWDLAVSALGVQGTVTEMMDYLIKYKDLILEARIDEIFATDFTKEIKPGTNPKTANLIKKLIDTFKDSWLLANKKDKSIIQYLFQSMTSKCLVIKAICDEIEDM